MQTVRTEGLGDSIHVLTHEGVSMIVDPQRDIERFESILDETGAELRFVLETHLHNNYVSGGLDLARKTGGRPEVLTAPGLEMSGRHIILTREQ